MAARTPTMKELERGLLFNCEFGEVTVSNTDTVTFTNFSTTDNLLEAYFIKKTDGSEMTCTHAANNVATISGAGTNIRCMYIVYGYKA